MLQHNFIRKISKLHDELHVVYQEMQKHKKSINQFCIGEAAEFLRLAMLVMQDLERKVA